jgi:hypothetical protein
VNGGGGASGRRGVGGVSREARSERSRHGRGVWVRVVENGLLGRGSGLNIDVDRGGGG